MTKLTLNSAAREAAERKRVIEAERPKYTFRHAKTREEVQTHPHDFFREHKFNDLEIGKIIYGKVVKGWVFNVKWLLNEEELYQRALRKKEKARIKKAKIAARIAEQAAAANQ